MDKAIHCLGLPCPENYIPPVMPCTMHYWDMVNPQKYNPFLINPSRQTCSLEIDKALGKNRNRELCLKSREFCKLRLTEC